MTAKTTAPVAANVTQITAQKSKIEQAKAIFAGINAEGYVSPEGSTPRKDFIAKCISDLGMTENGASTYWQNCRNEAAGEGIYKNAKAPTGAPRGRKPDPALRVKRAAARVQKLRNDVATTMNLLTVAESELIEAAAPADQQAS